ncbi:MAG: glycosyltransferase family 4 protein [Burkholderiales bacterium]|nr:glycosyltransferase family 4 protein [Burkholderiales bacterium]
MRLLIVTQYFWPEAFRVNDLALGLKSLGHEVEVLTGMPNYPQGSLFPGYGWLRPASEEFEGIRVVRVPMVTRGRSKGLRLALNYLSFAVMASLLGPLRCRGRFDAVLIFQPSPVTIGLPGLLMSAIKKAPALIWIQDLWPDTLEAMGFRRSGIPFRVAAWLSDFVHRRCERVLAQSRAYIPRIEARGVAPSRIAYLPNWAESFYRPLFPQENIADPMAQIRGFRVVFAGNIGSAQAFDTIIGAARELQHVEDLHWVVLGDGNMKAWLEAEIARHGLGQRFHLPGRRPPEDMPAYFAHADVLLVTLRSDPVFSLTIPSKIQSYLACAKPVVASLDGEGAAIMRECGAGAVCSAEDVPGLASAVLAVHRMTPQERVACGMRGRKYYEDNFERTLLLNRLDEWIKQLARN